MKFTYFLELLEKKRELLLEKCNELFRLEQEKKRQLEEKQNSIPKLAVKTRFDCQPSFYFHSLMIFLSKFIYLFNLYIYLFYFFFVVSC